MHADRWDGHVVVRSGLGRSPDYYGPAVIGRRQHGTLEDAPLSHYKFPEGRSGSKHEGDCSHAPGDWTDTAAGFFFLPQLLVPGRWLASSLRMIHRRFGRCKAAEDIQKAPSLRGGVQVGVVEVCGC
jgi:hypothetical protein